MYDYMKIENTDKEKMETVVLFCHNGLFFVLFLFCSLTKERSYFKCIFGDFVFGWGAQTLEILLKFLQNRIHDDFCA